METKDFFHIVIPQGFPDKEIREKYGDKLGHKEYFYEALNEFRKKNGGEYNRNSIPNNIKLPQTIPNQFGN